METIDYYQACDSLQMLKSHLLWNVFNANNVLTRAFVPQADF